MQSRAFFIYFIISFFLPFFHVIKTPLNHILYSDLQRYSTHWQVISFSCVTNDTYMDCFRYVSNVANCKPKCTNEVQFQSQSLLLVTIVLDAKKLCKLLFVYLFNSFRLVLSRTIFCCNNISNCVGVSSYQPCTRSGRDYGTFFVERIRSRIFRFDRCCITSLFLAMPALLWPCVLDYCPVQK